MTKLLEVKNLSVELNGVRIIRDVTFAVEQGQTVAVIGPNGSGKTTLFRALMGILPHQGEIIWHRKVRVGYVPQQLEFDRAFPLTVREMFLLKRTPLDFWFQGAAVGNQIENALDHVHGKHLIDRRVGIDIGGEATVYNLIEHLAEELKLTVFLISHDIAVVLRYVDQVLCINQHLLCSGIPEQVLTSEQLRALYGTDVALYRHAHKEGKTL